MSEFGHIASITPNLCLDAWGAGPFIIETGGRKWRFEDSDRFGPALVKRNGDLLANPYPPERSPFWTAHRVWIRQGRRLEGDGVTCIWDEPKRWTARKIGQKLFVVEYGEEDGETVILDEDEQRTP